MAETNVCGEAISRVRLLRGALIALAACVIERPAPQPREHDWAAEWSSDGGGHWHECAADGCRSPRTTGRMGIVDRSDSSAGLTYPGCKGLAGVARAGSVEVALHAGFLKTPPAGTCTLEAGFEDGETAGAGSTEFTVTGEKNQNLRPIRTTRNLRPIQSPHPTPNLRRNRRFHRTFRQPAILQAHCPGRCRCWRHWQEAQWSSAGKRKGRSACHKKEEAAT